MFYRQGDVIISQTNEITGNPVKDNSRGNVILAEGEVTGHAHRIMQGNGEVQMYENEGTLYLKVVSEKATITHEEHKNITLPRGDYLIRIQREYDPEVIREVAD